MGFPATSITIGFSRIFLDRVSCMRDSSGVAGFELLALMIVRVLGIKNITMQKNHIGRTAVPKPYEHCKKP